MDNWNKLRNYEVSVWTLLDNYITTLKSGDPISVYNTATPAAEWPQARAQGQILNGKITLNIDGTLNLSFDIPMYLFINGKTVENPNWYNAINENILVSMRKIKVIFNKWENVDSIKARSASTFEFLITKVLEEHDSNNALVCHVECEGLAFHELGKIGYKRSLSVDLFNEEYYDWSVTDEDDYTSPATKAAAEPMATISYWMESKTNGANIERVPKIDGEIDYDALNPTLWYYDVLMAHSSLVHENEVLSDKIYEEGFPVDWADSETPINFIETREMTRLIEIKESNLYNITLDLAEKFLVFCRYLYIYDTNYNIIGRLIIFYNNFIKEDEGMPTLLYPSSVSRVEREMDSTDISTKMFVRSVDADDVYTGSINIMDSSANRTREDYVMNFDYLHDIGTISDELYNAIPEYEAAIRELNDKLTPLLNADGELNKTKLEVDAKIKVLENSIELDLERITENNALIEALNTADGDDDEYITVPFSNPDVLYLMKDNSDKMYDSYYILFNLNGKAGINKESVELYSRFTLISTSTILYVFGFTRPLPENNISNGEIAGYEGIPISADTKPVYMGTIGALPTITVLPKEPANKDAYKVLMSNYPSGYTVLAGKWLYYDSQSKTWKIQNNSTGLTNKGTIGKKPDTTELPTTTVKEGMIYLALNANYPSGNTIGEGGIYFYSKDYNGNTNEFTGSPYWHTVNIPDNTYKGKGIYIVTSTTVHLTNGLEHKSRTCTRYGNDASYVEDYMLSAELVFYVTKSNVTPSKPTAKTATSVATEIKSGNVLDNWSYYRSTPDDYESLNLYKYHISWRCKVGSNITFKDIITVNGSNIINTVVNAKERFLPESARVYGTMVDDDYGNLDKITGLFATLKETEITTYLVLSKSELWTNALSISSVYVNTLAGDSISNDLIDDDGDITGEETNESTKKPSKLSNQYLLTHTTKTDSGGNVYSTYKFTYYGADGKIATAPLTQKNTYIKKIMPVYYLTTNNSEPNLPADNAKVSNKVCTNAWTSAQPRPTDVTKNSYYSGILITYFDGSKKYLSKTQLHLKALPSNSASSVPNYIYAIYKYKPDLYYEKIKLFWMDKLDLDTLSKEYLEIRQDNIDTCINEIENQINTLLDKKDNVIKKFEQMMGAALRESYWQPENEYLDYGAKHKEELKLINTVNVLSNNTTNDMAFMRNTDNNFASIVWDEILFNEELDNYYETTTALDKEYYLCIDLTKVTKNLNNRSKNSFLKLFRKYGLKDATAQNYNPFCFFFNPNSDTIPVTDSKRDIRYMKYYTIGSEAKFGFVRKDNNIIPVLLLIGASGLSNEEIEHLKATAYLGQLISSTSSSDTGNHVILNYNKKRTFKITDGRDSTENMWINAGAGTKYKMVYPRLYIPSLKLKNNDKDLVLKMLFTKDDNINDTRVKTLTKFEDFSVLTKTYYYISGAQTIGENIVISSLYNKIEDVDNWSSAANSITTGYVISIKPEVLFKYAPVEGKDNGVIAKFRINYAISNADIDIYIDSLNILKENAYPKVSYSLDVSPWSRDLLPNIYQRLALIVKVNDYDLKLQNTFGYISLVELDLDNEELDNIEIKNYKTKFEDLFSKIVAETEEMHKNSRNIGLAGSLAEGASVSSTLTPEAFEETILDTSIQDTLIDFLNKYFDGPNVVLEHILKMWNEAGEILGAAAVGLNNILNLTSENASILAGFRENVSAALTPSVYTDSAPPSVFKPGDVWMYDGERAVATGYGGEDGGGFIKTYNGKLAEIVGANVEVDANAGTVKITGETEISLESGKDINIAAGDNVNIIGNKEVNIGGTTINIAAVHLTGEDDTAGGIHLISSEINGDNSATSRVDLHGEGIEMASRKGIVIKSGAGIDIKSSNDLNVSAILIDKDTGIFMGVGYVPDEKPDDVEPPKFRIYSGTIEETNDITTHFPVGASVELSAEHLILGMGNVGTSGATTILMTTGEILLAAGDHLNLLPHDANTGEIVLNDIITDTVSETVNGVTTTYHLSGIQIKPDYIGMATGAENNRSIISIKPNLVLLGQMTLLSGKDATLPESYTGSYLWLSNSEVYIGGMGNFTLNTNNIKIQTKYLENYGLNGANISADATAETAISTLGFALGKNFLGSSPEVGLGFWIDKNGQKHLKVDGDVTARQFTAISTNGRFIANGTQFGLYKTDGSTGIITVDANGNITAGGNLTISSGKTLSLIGSSISIKNNSTDTALTIDGNGINLSGKSFKIDIDRRGSNETVKRRFYINTDKLNPVQEESDTPHGAFMMYLGSEWDDANTQGMRFNTYSGQNDTPGFEVKGAITATSFLLSGNAVTLFNSAALAAAGSTSYNINGLSSGFRKLNENYPDYNTLSLFDKDTAYNVGEFVTRPNGVGYKFLTAHPAGETWTDTVHASRVERSHLPSVELTSTSALVLGADAGFYIVKDNKELDSTYVSVTKSNINFDFNNSSIHMSKDGIELTGSRIKINDKDIWARDDIIILKKSGATGYESQDAIETRMSSSHDWVLIKPYYDAKFNFYYTNVFSLYDDTPTTVAMISNSSNPYFGTITSGTPYHYTIKCKLHLPTASQGILLLLYALNKNDSSNTRSRNPVSGNCTIASDVISASDITIDNNGYISFNSARVLTLTITLNSTNTNLCEEGYSIYIKATARNATNANSVTIHELLLICEADTVAGRVPCTVYYYP